MLTCTPEDCKAFPVIIKYYKPENIEDAYYLFENKLDGIIKVAVSL